MTLRQKLILFDGTFQTTTFINRRAALMAKENKVYILGFNERLKEKVPGVRYVALGSNQNILRLVWTSFSTVLRSGRWWLWFPMLFWLLTGNRKKLQQQNLNLSLKRICPDEIHLQWPSLIPWFEKVLEHQTYPVFLWQRGFHINVRPFVNPENLAYLQKWFPKMAGFISVSKAIRDVGDTIWNSPDKKNEVVYTTLDLKDYEFHTTYRHSKPLRILSVGRDHWIKGYEYALRACLLLKAAKVDFEYTIIGGITNESYHFIRNDMGLTNRVILEGKKPHREVVRAMRDASVLLLPSIEEGLPNVVVEAMALGLPVISSDTGGIPELINPDENGILFPSRDVQAMAQAIEKFSLLSPAEVETLRQNGRRAAENFIAGS